MIIKSLNEYCLDVYRCKATELRLQGLLSLPVCHEVDVARPTASAQSSGGLYTLPALVTRLKWRPLSEAQQVYFAVRPQAGAITKVGCANQEPGASVCSSSHSVYLLRIPMYWVYLNGYKKCVGLGWWAPRGVAPLLWLSIGSRLGWGAPRGWRINNWQSLCTWSLICLHSTIGKSLCT